MINFYESCLLDIYISSYTLLTLFLFCGARSSNFNAELQALQLAVDYLIDDEGCYNKDIFFLLDYVIRLKWFSVFDRQV